MAIKQIVTDMTGEIGVIPRIIRIFTDDSFAAITAANYLSSAIGQGYTFNPGDIAAVTYGTTPVTQLFTVSISSSAITLKAASVDDATKVLTSAITTPDTSSNLIAFDVSVTAAALASGGAVALYTSATGKQYKVRGLWLNSGGTNFSGGSGDRLLNITDGTTVYSQIAAADLQTLPGNIAWGNAKLPFPASAALNVSTVAGQNLRAVYSGGTADYTAGSVVISGLLQRVA